MRHLDGLVGLMVTGIVVTGMTAAGLPDEDIRRALVEMRTNRSVHRGLAEINRFLTLDAWSRDQGGHHAGER